MRNFAFDSIIEPAPHDYVTGQKVVFAIQSKDIRNGEKIGLTYQEILREINHAEYLLRVTNPEACDGYEQVRAGFDGIGKQLLPISSKKELKFFHAAATEALSHLRDPYRKMLAIKLNAMNAKTYDLM